MKTKDTKRPMERNPYLTPAMERCLRAMQADEDGELVYERGQVWVGLTRFGSATLNRLLSLCLLHSESTAPTGSGYEIYYLNEDGRGVLDDPRYVPRIARPNFGEAPSVEPARGRTGCVSYLPKRFMNTPSHKVQSVPTGQMELT